MKFQIDILLTEATIKSCSTFRPNQGYGGSSLFFGGFTGICEFIVGDWVSSD